MNSDRLKHVALMLDEYDKRGEDPPRELEEEYKRGSAWLKNRARRAEKRLPSFDPYEQGGIR